MDEVWKELIKALPWGFVIIALRYMDIKAQITQQAERDKNATDKSNKDRETQIIIGKTYADAINNLASVFNDLKTTIIEQYKEQNAKMAITQELFDLASERYKEPETKQRR